MNKFHLILHRTLIGLLFATAFVPLIIPLNSFFFPFITGKAFAFRILIELAALIYGILILWYPDYRPKRSALAWTVGVFLSVVTVADLFGVNPIRSIWSNYERMEGLILWYHLVAYCLLLGTVFREKLWNAFLGTSIGVAIVMCLYSLVQLAGKLVINQGGVRVDGTFGNATYLAVYLLFHLFLLTLWVWRDRAEHSVRAIWAVLIGSHLLIILYGFKLLLGLSDVGKQSPQAGPFMVLAYFVSLLVHTAVYFGLRNKPQIARGLFLGETGILFLYVLFNTATRGAMLGLLAGGALSALMIGWRSDKRWVRTAGAGIFAGVAGLVLVFFLARNTSFVRDNAVLRRFAEISLTERTTQSRFVLWGMALEGWKEHPILGWGQENFNLIFNKYYKSELYTQEQWFDRAHSVFFDWLVSGGILGLLSYLALFAVTIYLLAKSTTFSFVERALLLGLLVAYFIQNLTVFDNLVSGMYFMIILAFVHFHEVERLGSLTKEHERVERWMPSVTFRDGALFGMLVIFVSVVYFVDVKAMVANHDLILALRGHQEGVSKNLEYFKGAIGATPTGDQEAREQLIQIAAKVLTVPGIDPHIKETVVTYAIDEMTKQTKESPGDARTELFLGDLYLHVGAYPEALTHLERSHELSPKKQFINFELGQAYFLNKKIAEGLAMMKEAYDATPGFEEAVRWYSAALVYAGREEEGLALYHGRVGTSTPLDDRFINAYAMSGNYKSLVTLWRDRVNADPSNAQAHVSLGLSYYGAGDHAKSIEELEKAAKLNPALKNQVDSAITGIRAGKSPL